MRARPTLMCTRVHSQAFRKEMRLGGVVRNANRRVAATITDGDGGQRRSQMLQSTSKGDVSGCTRAAGRLQGLSQHATDRNMQCGYG